jgi:anti-anti-sigma factor
MRIEEQKQGAVAVVRPIGPLTGEAAGEFKTHLLELNGRTLGRFVLDAGAVSFVDSGGLEALLEVSEVLIRSGRMLRMFAANETLLEVLTLTGLATSFEHYDDMNAALRSFR